jgi:signal peptidase I
MAFLLYDGETIGAVRRASAHAAARAHEEMRRGVASLAGIATAAPLIGFFGTVLGIVGSFRSYGSSRSTILADVTSRLSESLAPAILGLAVAIVSFWSYRYLSAQMEAFDREMENASVDLVNRLVVHLGRLGQPAVRGSLPPAAKRAPSVVEAPRLAIDERTYRNRLLELAWPQLTSESDARSVLHFAMWIALAFGFIGWLTCFADRRPAAGLVIFLFFAAAARRVRAGSLAAILGVFTFLAFAALLCIISSGWTLAAVYLLTAPLLLVSSARAARIPAAKPVFSISSVLLGLLGVAASTTVLFGTVLTLYPTGMDWIVSLRAPLMGPVQRGELVAFRNWNLEGTERVVGLPGDRIRVVSGKLIRNGKEVVQSCCQQPFTEYLGNFPLPKDAVFDGDLQFEYLNAYGDRLLNKTEFIVPDESYFLLNDNRNELLDSRVFGPVWTSHIVGRPLCVYSAWRVPRLLH